MKQSEILQLATKGEFPAHLLLGSDAVQCARRAEDKQKSEAKVRLEVSVLTDAEGVQGHPALELCEECRRNSLRDFMK